MLWRDELTRWPLVLPDSCLLPDLMSDLDVWLQCQECVRACHAAEVTIHPEAVRQETLVAKAEEIDLTHRV